MKRQYTQFFFFCVSFALTASGQTSSTTTNMLQNGAFETSSAPSSQALWWRAVNKATAVSFTQYCQPGRAHDGCGFLEMNTQTTGGSVAQDVTTTITPGQSFHFSVWLKAGPGTPSVSGTVALWGLGGVSEYGSTNFTVGQTWTQISAPLDVEHNGHSVLRAEIYMASTGVNFDVDGALLVNADLENASFETSAAGWHANNLASFVSYQQVTDTTQSREGSGFLRMNMRMPEGSIAQDVTMSPLKPGQSYLFSVWVRAASASFVSGTVALWGLGGAQESNSTRFVVGPNWTQVSTPLDVKNNGHSFLRAEIYIASTGANVDVDGALLVNTGLENASFETSTAGWRANNLSGDVSYRQMTAATQSHAGSGLLEMSTRMAEGSIAQDVASSPEPGQTYVFSVWLRSSGSNFVSGTVALWGLGGGPESSSTNFAVGPSWTQVIVPLYINNLYHTTVRAEIYMATTGANFEVDDGFLIASPTPPTADGGGYPIDTCEFDDTCGEDPGDPGAPGDDAYSALQKRSGTVSSIP